MAKAALTGIPPKMEEAFKTGSVELVELADSFRLLSIYVEY
jgi:SpoU rRNA methylase family enzyme